MFRKIQKVLENWQISSTRKPLILQGARQVGKTYAILEFGQRRYENVAYFNFETDPNLMELFSGSISPKHLLGELAHAAGVSIVKGRTLIVFDEVQLCERALTSLKYFCEEANDYHVIVAGSLLGVAVNRSTFSFPVGKVDIETMLPMDFEEFALAVGEGELVEKIRRSYETNEPFSELRHASAMKLYREYLVIGGMPECVNQYVQMRDFNLVRHKQKMILMSYLNDMSKYNRVNEIKKVHLTYDNVTVQLAKPNTRFQYKLIKKGARSAEFENAIEWLVLSGIVGKVYRIEQAMKPLENYRDVDSFKIYVSDTGLLCAKKNVFPGDVTSQNSDLNDFKGGMTENYVYCQLLMNGYEPFYWSSPRGSEVDFVIERDGKIIPVEVKSAENTQAKSLKVFMDRYNCELAIKLSARNFGVEGNKKSVPLYAAFCI